MNEELNSVFEESIQLGMALQEIREHHQNLLHSKALLYTHDLQGQFLSVNENSAELLGYNKNSILKMNIHDILAPEVKDEFETYLSDVQKNGFTEGLMLIQTKTGEKRILEYHNTLYTEGVIIPTVQGIAYDITDYKQTKKKLKQLSEQLSIILESLPIVSYTLEGDYRPTYVTHNVKMVTGFEHTEFMSKPFFWSERIHPEDSPRIFANFPQLFDRGYLEHQYRWQVADGSYKWFYDHLRLIKSSDGKKYIAGMMQDITERKRAEEEIQRSYNTQTVINSLLHLSLENIPLEEILRQALEIILSIPWLSFESRGGIFIVENNVLIMKVQKGLSEPIQESCAKVPFGRCLCGKAALSQKIQFSNCLDESHEIRYEGIISHGHYCVPILSADKILGVINIYIREGHPRDQREEEFLTAVANTLAGIIMRKRTEEALLYAAQQWRTTFDSINDFVCLLDLEGKILRCNKAMKNFIGLPFNEIINGPCWEMVFGNKTPIEDCPFLRMKKTLHRETTILSFNDKWFNVAIDPILDEANHLIGAVNIISDITERKQAEERMKTLQEQFLQSQKMEAIGQLAGGVAHDFNNLLTVINGYSDLILEDLDEKNRFFQDVKEIKKASEHAASLTRQLLAFSRKQILQPKILDINSVVLNMDKMLRRMIGEDIQMVTLLPKDLGRVKADPGQIEQVIFNLAVNARDAMPKGGKLTIETADVELDEEYARTHVNVTPGHYVMISISDNGIGMSKEIIEHIFEPFFTTKEKGTGTGLGLATVYGIIKQSGGNIWIYSEPGQGTTIKIYLPQLEEDDEMIEQSDLSHQSLQGSETILLVEDEEGVRRVARAILERNGYSILEASNAEEALRSVQENHSHPIHLLLTDVVMPGMNGRELADRLILKRPEMKVLFMSGYTGNAIIHHEILKVGMAYIQKPFTPNTLTHKVREILDGRQGSSESSPPLLSGP